MMKQSAAYLLVRHFTRMARKNVSRKRAKNPACAKSRVCRMRRKTSGKMKFLCRQENADPVKNFYADRKIPIL